MNQKMVTLVRKKGTPFIVNYPIDGRIKKFTWRGSSGKLLDERKVPFEVYDWLALYTTTFQDGELIIKDDGDEEVLDIKENLEGVKEIENVIMTKEEVIKMLTTGNHLSLKSKLEKLVDGKPQSVVESQKRYIIGIASEIGIDSSAKRKVLADWAGIDYEHSDLLFDKNLQELYDEEPK